MTTAIAATNIFTLVAHVTGARNAASVLRCVRLAAPLETGNTDRASRAVIAQALSLVLLHDLLERVPAARRYVTDLERAGTTMMLDHGAVRTVAGDRNGALPRGIAAFERILIPLGFERAATYSLEALRMTGYAYRHKDLPDAVSQFFVSELHPDRFSSDLRAAVERVVGTSRDPLNVHAQTTLDALALDGTAPMADAMTLVRELRDCFGRAHDIPTWDDYACIRRESPEMAWIATEGNAFNHAADRVTDVDAVAREQRLLGRPMKATIEVSRSGRVRQTAYLAQTVAREFSASDGSHFAHDVPGSFFEFISRDRLPDDSGIDLAFDAGNARGIFAMTSAP